MEATLFEYLSRIDYRVPHTINAMKHDYKDLIASKRRNDAVCSLSELLQILRKRDCISPTLLDNIVARLEDADVTHKYNAIKNEFLHKAESTQDTYNSRQTRNEHLDDIYDCICNQLGTKHWRDFARYLGVKEAQIDALGLKYSTKECIRRVLMHHEQSAIGDWRQQLLNALGKAHRSDIQEQVAEKLDYYNLTQPQTG